MEEEQILLQEEKSSPYTQEQVDQLMRGERPEGMDFEKFKFLRALVKKMQKNYKKGQMLHLSSWLEPIEGTKYERRVTKTYIKPETNVSKV